MTENIDNSQHWTYTGLMENETLPKSLIDEHYDDLSMLQAQDIVQLTEHDLQLIEEMAAIACTPQEVCGVLRIPPELMKLTPKAKEAMKRGRERAKVSLRRIQFRMAQKNVAMAIFLGKNMLGQADKVETKEHDKELDNARKSFMDKLKNTIDVTPKGKPVSGSKRTRKGKSSPVPVGTVGKGSSTTPTG